MNITVMLLRHARLQRMTYASKIKIDVQVQVYTPKKVQSDKFKTGKEESIDREIIMEEKREITFGRLPVMVKSDLCWMSDVEKGDCEFDHGGYFLIKGAEKRLWVSNIPYWAVAYKSQMKRNRMVVNLVENSSIEGIKNEEKLLTIYFFVCEIPVWILFYALGATSGKEIVDLINY